MSVRKKGILISRSKAKENAETEYGNLQTDETQSDYFVALKKAIADNGIDEDKYLDLLYSEAYYKYNRIVLKMDFNKNLYDENGSGTDEEQFKAYVKKSDGVKIISHIVTHSNVWKALIK